MKNKIVLVFFMLIILSACASGEQVRKNLDNQMDQEDLAWNKVFSLAKSECGFVKGEKVIREEVVQQRMCINGLVEKYLIPVAAFPDLERDTGQEILEIAKAYERKKITEKQYRDELQSISENNAYAWVRAANEKIIDADRRYRNGMAQTRMWAGALSAAAQTYNADIERQQAYMESQRQQQQINQPMRFQCRELLDNVHCEEY